jgi:hypothetical protein
MADAPNASSIPALIVKRGGTYNYVLKDGDRDLNNKLVDIDTTALVIGVSMKSRRKLDDKGSQVFETKEVNTTKGKQTIKLPVDEQYPIYDAVIWHSKWADPKRISKVEASAFTAL